MIRQFCTVGAPNGDCYRACLATIIGLPAQTMPNFMHTGTANGDEGTQVARDWLRQHGLTIFDTWADGAWPIERVLRDYSAANAGAAIILQGWSDAARDAHCIVVLDGAIVHDPSGLGLSGPTRCACKPDCDYKMWAMQVVCPISTGFER